jgi:hypothetical protein
MRPQDYTLEEEIKNKLITLEKSIPLPGISSLDSRNCFINQIIDSVRRIKYVSVIKNRAHSHLCADATSIAFDPIKAASWHKAQGNVDEAYWLVFLTTHFGKNLITKWRLVQDVYGGLGNPVFWSWDKVSNDIYEFRNWLNTYENILRKNGKFGNHRKYESLNAFSKRGTGQAVHTYINWILTNGNHQDKMKDLLKTSISPRQSFLILYKSMNEVTKFGRTARFDYLTMLGKLELLNIEPDSTYMKGSTGPIKGAKLLFGSHYNLSDLNDFLEVLESELSLYYGMQVLEDSLCNWQKSPSIYKYFRG